MRLRFPSPFISLQLLPDCLLACSCVCACTPLVPPQINSPSFRDQQVSLPCSRRITLFCSKTNPVPCEKKGPYHDGPHCVLSIFQPPFQLVSQARYLVSTVCVPGTFQDVLCGAVRWELASGSLQSRAGD